MNRLSERALNFIGKTEENKEYEIGSKILEEHLNLYHLNDSSKIKSFFNQFSGLTIQDYEIRLFARKQIEESKRVKTYYLKGKTLFALNIGFYISEHGEIALRNYESYLGEFYFFFESFETFIEQQAFFEEYRYLRELPGLGNKLNCSINHLPAYFSNYEFITECSDKYHRIWKNKTN